MLENIPAVLKSLATAGSALKAFADMRARTRGEARALVEELKENSRLCWLVIEEDVPVEQIIPDLSSVEYDRLNKTGFDFDALKRKKISLQAGLQDSDLASWAGKPTRALVENIYDKIKNLKTTYRHAPRSEKRRWKTRIFNIQKRILLLLEHCRN
ncbi:MAG: hypothetical protein LJE74_12080 [Proteobacteria bacterium]|jgi:hypothetical protein|nr:hypothetical protein [Pseudomonadota bacterium]MCG6934399.1 hypothetical protein [Pseudomonadota bacterium]